MITDEREPWSARPWPATRPRSVIGAPQAIRSHGRSAPPETASPGPGVRATAGLDCAGVLP